ncbi:pentatricopeptide repeat-containing protein At2g35030, mitochondrial-like [Selaginella moellendorffii]|uniref:pentatricopeptide repeat-containing protein At2g35030, mitochondrial-like n=1 Tax=Selaginella moellendorffii TaxID=88036 RepID=UPI000D1C3863|nr:pentatricopeptide repeat-containing protein At2g35030, mitochondrial-like [Selaginella moellendorffii]|eukprot:XP_024522546.1 pentatricopeptide repeat-containing protein At2g35030, mitochondrial-like [Selaginella moellendorffii]
MSITMWLDSLSQPTESDPRSNWEPGASAGLPLTDPPQPAQRQHIPSQGACPVWGSGIGQALVRSPRNVISWTAIVADYSHSGHIAEAEAIFQRMLHDTIAGNAMVTAHAHHWHLREAFTIFDTMPVKNDLSWNLMLQAFTVNSSPEDAPHFFESVPCRNVVSWNALLAAVAQRRRFAEASRTFEMMPQLELASWNTIITSWNTLIAGYAENGSYKTAVELFRELNLEGLKPTESTFVALLCNCGELTSTSC